MSGTVNAVVNNLADRLGEVVEVLNPVVEKVGLISQTLVQETANYGCVYTMFGLCLVGIACLAVLGIVFSLCRIEDCKLRYATVGWLIGTVIIFTFTGFMFASVNLGDWIAPTKSLFREIVSKI